MLSPLRLKGLGAFVTSFGIYAYLPYIALFTGGTAIPIAAILASLGYGAAAFAEGALVNSIKIIDSGEDQGKIRISIAKYTFASEDIIVDPKDVVSVVSLGNDD